MLNCSHIYILTPVALSSADSTDADRIIVTNFSTLSLTIYSIQEKLQQVTLSALYIYSKSICRKKRQYSENLVCQTLFDMHDIINTMRVGKVNFIVHKTTYGNFILHSRFVQLTCQYIMNNKYIFSNFSNQYINLRQSRTGQNYQSLCMDLHSTTIFALCFFAMYLRPKNREEKS